MKIIPMKKFPEIPPALWDVLESPDNHFALFASVSILPDATLRITLMTTADEEAAYTEVLTALHDAICAKLDEIKSGRDTIPPLVFDRNVQ